MQLIFAWVLKSIDICVGAALAAILVGTVVKVAPTQRINLPK